jgi:hypothetical protein
LKTIETIAVVTPDHRLTVQLPEDVTPGEHHVVVVIDLEQAARQKREPLQFSAYPVGLVSDAFTFRREDLYGDDGR